LLARSELTRYQATEIPFSIAIVDFENVEEPLTDAMLASIADCFYQVCQPVDIMACKNYKRLFFLLPHSEETIAAGTMKKFLKNLFVLQLPNDMQGSALGARIGIASVPRDSEDFVILLTRANQRRNSAHEAQPIVQD
jgi:GGDEF domain-containing protein